MTWLPSSLSVFQDVLDSLTDSVIGCDAHGRLCYFNRAAEELYGPIDRALGPEQRVRRYGLYRPDGVTPLEADEIPLLRALREGRVEDAEIGVRSGGACRLFSCKGTVIRDAAGVVHGAFVAMHEVTDRERVNQATDARARALERRKAAEDLAEKLRLSEQKYRALVEVSPQIVWIGDPIKHVTFLNEYWYNLTGLSVQESLGTGWTNAVHPDDRSRVIAEWLDAAKNHRSFKTELRLGSRTGEFRWFLIQSTLHRPDPGSDTIQWVGTGVDINEQKWSEANARQQAAALEELNRIGETVLAELRLEPFLQTVTDAAVNISGAAYGAFFHNAEDDHGHSYTLYAVSGAPRESFSGFPLPRKTGVLGASSDGLGIKRSDDITQEPDYGKNAPYSGMPMGHLPVRSYMVVPVRRPDGEAIGGIFLGHPLPGRFTAQHERLVQGLAVQAAIGVGNSRLYQVQQKLLESERQARAAAERDSRLKEEFLRTLSHELRSPLNAILGWTELLNVSRDDPAMVERAVETIKRNALAQTRLIDDLLDVSRIASGKVRLEKGSVELCSLIRNVMESVTHEASRKQIRMDFKIDSDPLLTIQGDRSRLEQVLWNLLTNAIKFTPEHGHIEVQVRALLNRARITIADSGDGIDPSFLPYIFEPFRQYDASTSRQHGGLGLGLGIVKSLVKLHGGKVWAASDGKGKGATFCVELPISANDASAASDPSADDDHADRRSFADLTGMAVLVVDDEQDSLDFMHQLLSNAGATVHTAISVREALELLEDIIPDVLYCDIGMPGQDGYELIKTVRSKWPERDGRRHLRAVAVTAFSHPQDRDRALQAGFDAHVGKPVDPYQIVSMAEKLFARQQADAGDETLQ